MPFVKVLKDDKIALKGTEVVNVKKGQILKMEESDYEVFKASGHVKLDVEDAVKPLEDMSFEELKVEAHEMGVEFKSNIKQETLLKKLKDHAIENGVEVEDLEDLEDFGDLADQVEEEDLADQVEEELKD